MKSRLTIALAFIMSLAVILSACAPAATPTEPPGPQPTDPAAAEATEPETQPEEPEDRSGGAITFSLYQEISDSLDPHVTNGTVNGMVYFHILDPLIWKTGDGYVPGLAESWDVSPDATEYTFNLRQDVTFHDGTPFNAEAVKANFDRIVDPETQSRIALGFMGSYMETEVVDEHTAVVRFEEPYAAFLDGVSQSFLGMVSPTAIEEYGAEVGLNLVGTGPYMLEEYSAGERVVMTRNPDYQWGPEIFENQGPAHLEQITFVMLLEDVSRVGALENGEVQGIERVPAVDIPRLEDQGYAIEVLLQPGMPISLMMNTENPPLDDVNVRQALHYAVDQQQLVDTLFPGVHQPATGPMSSATWGYNPDVAEMYEFDPDQAAQMLEDAGWTMGDDGIRTKDGQPLSLDLIFLTGTGFDETWQLVQAQLRNVGVDASLNGMAPSAALEQASAGEFHLMHLRWTFSDPDTMNVMWNSQNISGGTGFNFSKVDNEQVDELLASAASAQDLAERESMYHQVQELIMENAYLIPIYDEGNAVAFSDSLNSVDFDPRGRFLLFHDAYIEE